MNLGGRPVSGVGWINKKDFRRKTEDFFIFCEGEEERGEKREFWMEERK